MSATNVGFMDVQYGYKFVVGEDWKTWRGEEVLSFKGDTDGACTRNPRAIR